MMLHWMLLCVSVLVEVSEHKNKMFFFKYLDHISFFVEPLIPLFWTYGDVFSGFQSQSGQPYLHLVEVYVLHVP